MTPDELADAWLAAWSDGEPETFAGLCAPTIHYEDPLTQGPLRGAAAVAEHAAQLRAGLPDVRLEPAGERPRSPSFLAVPWHLRGSHTARLRDLPASGRELSLHGMFYCELDGAGAGREARLLRVRAFFDPYDAGVQLGVLPARGTLSERALWLIRGFGLRRSGS